MRAFIVLSGVLVILFLTNPDEQDFRDFATEQIEGSIRKRIEPTEFGKMLSQAGGAAVDMFIGEFMHRQNYYLFSIYTVDYDSDPTDGDEWKFIAFMETFRELNRPGDESNPIGVVE